MNTYFHGIWRMDWGFGNPNKTATLIATLMIFVWGLSYLRKEGFWAALVLFTALGFCLIHTVSRGGVVSLFAGLLPLVIASPRPWPLNRILSVTISVWLIIGFSVVLDTSGRFEEGLVHRDLSISNRLALWEVAPRMMVDAPFGWGLGRSGDSYMQWYQPLQHHEEYRTLVNSHLTWLVEISWPLRFIYIGGWLVIFAVCWPSSSQSWRVVALGIWISFFIAAFFSSVAESIWLWVLPVASFAGALIERSLRNQWPSTRSWPMLFLGDAAILGALALIGYGEPGLGIQGYCDHVIFGKTVPETWILVDEKVMGHNYGHAYRASQANLGPIGLTYSTSYLAKLSGDTLYLAGGLNCEDVDRINLRMAQFQHIVLLDPSYYPEEVKGVDLKHVSAYFGEFSQSPSLAEWKKALGAGRTQRVVGMGDFLSNWPRLVAASGRCAP